MFTKRLFSPLRYPGGKAPFAPFIASAMEINGLAGGHYCEPYAGGAGVALDLLFHGQASHIHINDFDPAVYAFWISVTEHTEDLLDLVEGTPVTIDEWFRWRAILRGEQAASLVERGFATLFVNRTNRSGILNAGVIGGMRQLGEYKLDARFKKDVIASRIRNIAARRESISVYCEDSIVLLKRCSDFLPKRSLIYLDPPYYVKGKGLYRNFYEHKDHLAIAKMVQRKRFKWPWIVSYDWKQEICEMYSTSQSVSYGLSYTAQKRYIGNEVMFFSQNLVVPDEDIPYSKSAA